MWIDRETYERLLTEAAQVKPLQNALAVAEERAVTAEDNLQEERQRKDWLITQLTSRVVTKHGQYGLEHEPHPQQDVPATSHPQGFIREPTERDWGLLEFYKQCAIREGKTEDDAQAKWDAVMRGERSEFQAEIDSEIEN